MTGLSMTFGWGGGVGGVGGVGVDSGNVWILGITILKELWMEWIVSKGDFKVVLVEVLKRLAHKFVVV